MADNEEESIENDDKNAQIETPEEEKAKKEDANEKTKTNNSPENQTTENDLPKEEHTTEETKETKEKKEEHTTEEIKETKETKEEHTTEEIKETKETIEEHNVNENSTEETKEIKDDKLKSENEERDKKVVQPSEEDVKKEQLSRTVDLKLAQTHYKTHTKTTLPHILTEYGMEDKDHPVIKKEKKERKKKKKKSSGDEKDESEDEDRQRRKAREEKFRQTFGDAHQTDTYYLEYIDFLEKKVASQRLKAEKQREEDKRLAALKEEEEFQAEEQKKQTPPPVKDKSVPVNADDKTPREIEAERQKLRLHKRLQRIDVKHDDSFLKDLPRTDISRIIVLQDKMKREGKLRTQGEVDKFWQDIKKPDEFYSQFKIKPTDPGQRQPMRQDSDTNTNENSDVFGEPAMAPRSLSHISETSRGEKEPWAITQKFGSSHGPKTPVPRKSSAQLAKEAALDLEKRCPKLEMPPLSCFSLQLGEKPPDPEEIQKKIELKLKEKNRTKTQRKVNRMYQMAMTNTAAANRILAQHNDLTSMFEGAALRDVLSVFDEPIMTGIRRQVGGQVSAIEPYRQVGGQASTLEPYQYGVDEDLDAASYIQSSTSHSSASSGHRLTPISQKSSRPVSKSRKSKVPLAAIEYPAPAPLSFSEVFTREKTIEAKCLSTNWTNYLQAGKSAFAQT